MALQGSVRDTLTIKSSNKDRKLSGHLHATIEVGLRSTHFDSNTKALEHLTAAFAEDVETDYLFLWACADDFISSPSISTHSFLRQDMKDGDGGSYTVWDASPSLPVKRHRNT